jgi:hypothetical protein
LAPISGRDLDCGAEFAWEVQADACVDVIVELQVDLAQADRAAEPFGEYLRDERSHGLSWAYAAGGPVCPAGVGVVGGQPGAVGELVEPERQGFFRCAGFLDEPGQAVIGLA